MRLHRSSATMQASPWLALGWLGILSLGVGMAIWAGCQPSKAPDPAEPAAAEVKPEPVKPAEANPENQASVSLPNLLLPGEGASQPGPGGVRPGQGAAPPAAVPNVKPQAVLEAMVKAYKAANSYVDQGQLNIRGTLDGQPMEDRLDFAVAIERPNKFHVAAYQGIMVSDGQNLWAYVMDLPGQVLKQPAPAEITMQTVLPDAMLAGALTQGPTQAVSWMPPQLVLLLAKDPLKTLLFRARPPEMLPSQNLGERPCYLVKFHRPDGDAVLWIDQETHVLRRLEYPVEALRQMLPSGRVEGLTMAADFNGAQLGGPVDPKAFQFEPPPDLTPVPHFTPTGFALLGKPAPAFTFTDLDGKPVTLQSLSGKITVIDFWATWCGPCRMTLPQVQKVYEQFKDKVAFLAVSVDNTADTVDGAAVSNQKLKDTLAEWGVQMPIARDPDNFSHKAFNTIGIPTTVILGADGAVQDYQSGGSPNVADELSAKLEKLLSGVSLAQEAAQRMEDQDKRFREMVKLSVEQDLFTPPMVADFELPQGQLAAKSDPQTLKLTPLFQTTGLKAPGNLLVVPRPSGPPRMLVLDGSSAVAEVAADGKVAATVPFNLAPPDRIDLLRTAVGKDGKRYFVGWALGGQKLHLFNEAFQHVVAFPAEAQPPHAGMADVELGDLDGNGALEMAVGYLGYVGVQGVGLDGVRLWSNRTAVAAFRLAILPPDASGKRSVLSTNTERGTLVEIDPEGKRTGEITVAGRSVAWFQTADLNGDGAPEFCGLSAVEAGKFIALGFDLQGKELWTYPLPKGIHQTPIEQVVGGNLLPGQPGQWVIAVADGSVHILGADGKPIDKFGLGVQLTGIATAQWDGQSVLLVSTPSGVNAWKVEKK